MRKFLIYILVALMILILAMFIVNINAVNITDEESVREGIFDYRKTTVNRVIMTEFDENEYFVLYDDFSGDLHLCIFEKTKFSFDRFYFASGGSSGGNLGDFYFSEGTGGSHKQLTVAYGRTSDLNDGKYEVLMENELLKVEPIEEFYLEVYREETKDSRMIWIEYN